MLACYGITDLTHAEKVILSVLAYHDGAGGCYPSYDRIMALSGMSRYAVARHLKGLEEKGCISRQRRQRKPTQYRIFYEGLGF